MTTLTRSRILPSLALAVAALLAAVPLVSHAAVPGITGGSGTPRFDLVATSGFISQPDGASIYSWGYGCRVSPVGFLPAPVSNSTGPAPFCTPGQMQMPGPTLIVTEGDQVTVVLRNDLPPAAGNTSIVFPGFAVTPSGGVSGAYTQEAGNGGGTVSYSFTASSPGTYAYYSGTQADLQIEMGLFGAIIVLPKSPPANCAARGAFSLSSAAYNNPATCYHREYLFQISELDSRIHDQVLAQVNRPCAATGCGEIRITSEPPRPNYFLINGRSMPDDMDTSYAPGYPRQPYNSNPHMHPGELLLMRIIGQGRLQHPFHFHGNHARVLARDGNLLVSAADSASLAGPLLFTTPTVSGQSQDQIFSWTGKNLNWDVWNHRAGDGSRCTPDANGYKSIPADPKFGEWCADHNKPIPATPPDPNIVAIGQWYGGTPYLGIQSTGSFTGTNEPPGTLNQNPQAGYAYMWHSHNEREITTNDVFPGGMLTMLLVDPPIWFIDETL